MSTWSVAASLFFSIALVNSASEAVSGAFSLAGAGNPAAIEQSLSGFVARMGGEVAVPKVMADAKPALVSFSVKPGPLQRGQDWVLTNGKMTALPAQVSGLLGLTDGRTEYAVKLKAWQDDNDSTFHYFFVGTAADPSIVLTFKAADKSYSINWRTDATGKLISTAYSDATGTRVVPNSSYSTQFSQQISYWDSIVPAGTSVASSSTGA